MDKNSFYAGILCALDVVATHGEGILFKNIIEETNDIEKILVEISKNGTDLTKKMAKAEFQNRKGA